MPQIRVTGNELHTEACDEWCIHSYAGWLVSAAPDVLWYDVQDVGSYSGDLGIRKLEAECLHVFSAPENLPNHQPLVPQSGVPGKRRRRASVTLACRFVAVGAVFGVKPLPRRHDLGSNLLRGHIGRRETEADGRCKQSKQSKNLYGRFSRRHGSATERLSDGATGPTGRCALRAHIQG